MKVKDGGMGATISNKVMLLFTLVFTLSKKCEVCAITFYFYGGM